MSADQARETTILAPGYRRSLSGVVVVLALVFVAGVAASWPDGAGGLRWALVGALGAGAALWRPAAVLAVLAGAVAAAPVVGWLDAHRELFDALLMTPDVLAPAKLLVWTTLALALEPLFHRLTRPLVATAASTRPSAPTPPSSASPAVARRAAPPLLVDTSALIDGRLVGLVETGLFAGPIVVPRAVLWELQRLRDSRVSQRRARGDRGLDQVTRLRAMTAIEVRVEDLPVAEDTTEAPTRGDDVPDAPTPVDRRLLALCRERGARLLTTDTPLCRLAEIEGVVAVNLHAVASALALRAVPGAQLELALTGPGEQPGQAVGHLPDGTRVIVRKGADRIGETVEVRVADLRKTRRGTLLFAELVPEASAETASAEERADGAPDGDADVRG